MKPYNEEWDESCNLPNYCECSYCQLWEQTGNDKERDPVWKVYEDEQEWVVNLNQHLYM